MMMTYFRSESGQSKIEQALIAALIVIVCILAVETLGDSLGNVSRSSKSLAPSSKTSPTR
jgi:Flp pilus assembly pilin Flp